MEIVENACIETIRCVGLELENLPLHNERMNRTRRALFGSVNFLDLRELIQPPAVLTSSVYKCRVTYQDTVLQVDWEPYSKRKITSLQLVHHETIDYSFKYRQRHDLDRLYSQRGEHDDVLIVRNGCLTDAYVCNIALYDGKTWWTPDAPLLRGTQRERLLQEGTVSAKAIRLKDLSAFTNIRLFNAMMPWPEAIELPVSRIFE